MNKVYIGIFFAWIACIDLQGSVLSIDDTYAAEEHIARKSSPHRIPFPKVTVPPDLEIEWPQECVLETQRIQIPHYSRIFNPSLLLLEDRFWMTFRIGDPLTGATHRIGFAQFDLDFHLLEEPQILSIEELDPPLPPFRQDPRLIACKGQVYLVYNNILVEGTEIRRMSIAQLRNHNGKFDAKEICRILHIEDQILHSKEKNWVPFVYQDELLLAYSISPHTIIQPLWEQNGATIQYRTETSHPFWKWGVLRGGTPAIPVEGEYLAFFHTCKDMVSLHSEGVKRVHYFMGAYTFHAEPPFAITRISPYPIVGPGFYHGPLYETWKPLHVVFPCGIAFRDPYIWVAYGRQDHEVWVVKLDKKRLWETLCAC